MDDMIETPYFLIHKNILDLNLERMIDAAKSFFIGGFIIGYSYKTNSLPWIINYFKNNGCYAEVVSDDEYNLGIHNGIEKDHFIYNGIIKSKKSFLEALKNGCIVNIDSQREICWLSELDRNREYRIGIRANFNIESECPGESQCGDEGGRFGFCYENGELEKALKAIRKTGFEPVCLHLHCSSKTRSLNIYRAISKYSCIIAKEYSLNLQYIDVGGGFFGGLSDKPQFVDYFQLIANTLQNFFDLKKIKIIVEPGMALIGSCVDYISKVIDVKTTTFNRFVIIDGSRVHIDPLMTKKTYNYQLYSKSNDNFSKQVVCGFTCMEHDRLMTLINEKELKQDDIIVFERVGAYTMCLSPLFIKYFPNVFVESNGRMQLVREKWGVVEYCSKGELV